MPDHQCAALILHLRCADELPDVIYSAFDKQKPQMTLFGLEAARMMDNRGAWTGKYGIRSAEQFLGSPEIQERALTDLLNATERQRRSNGAFRFIGTTIDGRLAPFTVTRAGLIAAGHREGARRTGIYLESVQNSGFVSRRARLADRIFVSRPAFEPLPTLPMNSQVLKSMASALLIVLLAIASTASAEEIRFRKSLTASERRCLAEILRTGHWRIMPEFHREMMAAAVVARPDLKGNGQKEYIFTFADFASCGTAGCTMLIGEARDDRSCRQIYDGSGSEAAVTVLRKRDHGYRRLYAPCELYFDGQQYQQVHEECPNADMHH